MAHIAMYRTWRPQSFQDVVGQKHIIRTLQNSLKEGRLSHAYLFSGPRGTGKTTAAKILAKAVNCENGPTEEPCNRCEACRRISEGSVMDVLEIDAASNRGVDEIRDLRDKVKYSPTEVRKKVYIIDEVHMLTTEAFNALLKTLEEPPGHVIFVLATTEPHRLPATIISRCQRFDFRRIAVEEQVERLDFVCKQEGVEAEAEALKYIARLSEGGMRDALSLLDQIAAFSDNRVTYDSVVSMTGGISSDQFAELAQAVRDGDVAGALAKIDTFMQEGKSADKCMENLLHYFRDLLCVKLIPQSEAMTDRILDPASFRGMADKFEQSELFEMIETLNRYQVEMKYSTQPQTLFEVAVMKLCTPVPHAASEGTRAAAAAPADSEEVRQLRQKLSQLEQQVERLLQQGVAPAAAGSSSASAAPARTSSSFQNKPSAPSVKRAFRSEGYIAGKDSTLFKQAMSKWPQVLAGVKDTKITVHAWLIDGEPVSYDQDTLLLAFKSAMHRETTEKPANKQLIEQVMERVYGHPMHLETVMIKDWQDAASQSSDAPTEVLELVPEDAEPEKKDWIEEAKSLFGESLVQIKE
jgi:DNA polymerase-3 subunit gamma/tau